MRTLSKSTSPQKLFRFGCITLYWTDAVFATKSSNPCKSNSIVREEVKIFCVYYCGGGIDAFKLKEKVTSVIVFWRKSGLISLIVLLEIQIRIYLNQESSIEWIRGSLVLAVWIKEIFFRLPKKIRHFWQSLNVNTTLIIYFQL